jgi:hypothetical protein
MESKRKVNGLDKIMFLLVVVKERNLKKYQLIKECDQQWKISRRDSSNG